MKTFSGFVINEFSCALDIRFRNLIKFCSLREIVAKFTIESFVGATFIGVIGVAKINRHPIALCKRLIAGKLFTVIKELAWLGIDFF